MSFKKRSISAYSDGNKPSFNFAQLLLERSDLLFQRANEFAINGDYIFWYKVLQSLKRTISFLGAKDTATEKTIKEKITDELKSMRGNLNLILTTQKNIELKNKVEEKLEQIEEQIILIMYNHGLYYPKYQDKKDWEEEAEGEDV